MFGHTARTNGDTVPAPPKNGNMPSLIWRKGWFVLNAILHAGRARCKLGCKSDEALVYYNIAKPSRTGMINHLAKKHPAEYLELKQTNVGEGKSLGHVIQCAMSSTLPLTTPFCSLRGIEDAR
jgi:hypothetical protein